MSRDEDKPYDWSQHITLPGWVKEGPVSYDDFDRLPDVEGVYYELVDGKLELLAASPGPRHQLVIRAMDQVITGSCDNEYFIFQGPLDVVFDKYNTREPDLLMVHRSRAEIITAKAIMGVPDLAAEVLSPYSHRRDRIEKLRTYERFGIPEFWIIDPKNATLEQYVLIQGERKYELRDVYRDDAAVQSDLLKCISFTMKEVMGKVPDLPNL